MEKKRTLVRVNTDEVQQELEKDFGIFVPKYMVFCIEKKIVNSPLWFEMWDWDNDVMDYFEYKKKKNKKMIETNSIEKKPVLDETNSVTGGQLMIIIIAFLGIICFLCFFGSLAMKTNEEQKQVIKKERIELNGKIYVEE